jgi:hypothetical protein
MSCGDGMGAGCGRAAVEAGRIRAGLTIVGLWLRFFSLGGKADPLEVDAYLAGLVPLPGDEYDILALAVNERLTDLGLHHLLRYTFDTDDDPA